MLPSSNLLLKSWRRSFVRIAVFVGIAFNVLFVNDKANIANIAVMNGIVFMLPLVFVLIAAVCVRSSFSLSAIGNRATFVIGRLFNFFNCIILHPSF